MIEVSRNLYAVCTQTNSVFCFGEDVDVYEDGRLIGHPGAWRAGETGARAGVMMPGLILYSARYYQEIAPDVAMDRAEIVSDAETVRTPAGTFHNCLKTGETTPLEADAVEHKHYAGHWPHPRRGPVFVRERGSEEQVERHLLAEPPVFGSGIQIP